MSSDVALQPPDVVTAWRKAANELPLALHYIHTEMANSPVLSAVLRSDALRVTSCQFQPPGLKPAPRTDSVERPAPLPQTTRDDPASMIRRATRFKPPTDTVKLADRLYYVLQPSLETVIAEAALEFPFQPFTYQFEGVAFLYPRVAAILADEMGLGKTMQAITAIRLLMHTAEIRSVLLVCPKPLVSNWQREFSQWAPELPVTVIEGDHSRRQWQWRLTDIPVKIANYELLVRDHDVFEQVDLVVLDEAQRIKNHRGATSQVVRSIPRSRAWALTGTPVENSSDDLVGIFEFLAPGHLHREMKPRAMGRAVSDFILRRTKEQVLTELPPKLFRDADIELSAEQRELRAGRGRGRIAADTNGGQRHDPACIRANSAVEADLQFRPGNRRKQQAGAAVG